MACRADRDPIGKEKISYSCRESITFLRLPTRSRTAIRTTRSWLFTYTHYLAYVKGSCDEPSLRMFSWLGFRLNQLMVIIKLHAAEINFM